MKLWKEYEGHIVDLIGKRNKYDNTIYTFDIETTSYIILYGKQLRPDTYLNLSEKEREDCIFQGSMYVWMFSVNDTVYYGRTWEDFRLFLERLEFFGTKEKKYVFVHNLSYEFQFLRNEFDFELVFARKSRKVIKAILKDFNIEFRCSYFLSNVSLEKLATIYNLPVKKLVGNLDYNIARCSLSTLSEDELEYCENDCLVVYEYIKFLLKTYVVLKEIPMTSTGFVRKELTELVQKNYKYRNKTRKSINIDGHVYNMLVDSFSGGYTHSNWLYSGEIIENVTSYDFTSSYPYCLVSEKYPSTAFRKCNIKKLEDLLENLAYIIRIKFFDIESKYFNNIISVSKCHSAKNIRRDNGRIIKADYVEMTINEIDLKLIQECYKIEKYEIIEIYYASKRYLPKEYINFILQKYENKTKFKNVKGKEIEYALEKAKFNALYGMTVTNNIRNNVLYDNENGWKEEDIGNKEILEKLKKEKQKGFLSFSWGTYCTSYARYNLISNLIKLDEFEIYSDTDSLKLKEGYNKKVIEDYNKHVVEKLKRVSEDLDIPFEKFAPKDSKGRNHCLGLFENETENGREFTYDRFITQGAKKYAYEIDGKISITVSGVPKKGAIGLKNLEDFKDDFVFEHKDTGKNLLIYNEEQKTFEFTDVEGNIVTLQDKYGSCIVPTTYVLGRSMDYVNLLTDESSMRAKFKEDKNDK